jgi:hypothetical protein
LLNGGSQDILFTSGGLELLSTLPPALIKKQGETPSMKMQSTKTLETRRNALLKELAHIGPFVQASFCTRKVKCGNPRCRCAKGQPHESNVLTRKVRGKTATTHVPRDLEDEVKAWANENKRLKKLIREISKLSDLIIRIHVRTNRAAARNRNLTSQTQQKSTKGS